MNMKPQPNSMTSKGKRTRHAFLLTLFDLPHKYEAKEVNGFVLLRQFNGDNKQWQVAIYTKDKYKKHMAWTKLRISHKTVKQGVIPVLIIQVRP